MRKRSKYRRYVCADCGKATMLALRTFDRAGRPRCVACGSIRLDPGASATDTLAAGHDAHDAQVDLMGHKAV